MKQANIRITATLTLAICLASACVKDEGDPVGFRSGLTCGLSMSEVSELAAMHDAERIECPSSAFGPGLRCYVNFGKTGYDLVFSADEKLASLSKTVLYGLKGMRIEPEESLCPNSLQTTPPS